MSTYSHVKNASRPIRARTLSWLFYETLYMYSCKYARNNTYMTATILPPNIQRFNVDLTTEKRL